MTTNARQQLTWNELADLYDRVHRGGRPARTLRMETVMEWAERQTGQFEFDDEGYVYKKKVIHELPNNRA